MEEKRGANRGLVPVLVIGGLGVGLGIGLWMGVRDDPQEGGPQPRAGAETGPAAATGVGEELAGRLDKRRDEERARTEQPEGSEISMEPAPRAGSAPPPPPPSVMKEQAERQPSAPAAPEQRLAATSEEERERYWRERAASMRDRLVMSYESCLAQAGAPYKYVTGEGRTVQIIDTSAFAEAKAQFLATQAAFRFLEDEARRAGVPPGWVRIDWNSYPRTPNPVDGTCERTLPEEIPSR